MIGTDSHTPNAGGLGMVAIGVGGADAVDVMTGFPFNVRWPKLIGVHLTGELSGWIVAEGRHPQGRRDPHRQGRHRRHRRVLRPRRRLDLRHRQGRRSATWAPRSAPRRRCSPTTTQHGRLPQGDRARGDRRRRRTRSPSDLRPDPEVEADPEPLLRPGHRDRPLDARAAHQRPAHARPRPPGQRGRRRRQAERLAARDLVGARSARARTRPTRTSPAPRRSPARPAAKGLRAKTQLLITPGSEQVRATIERDGLLADLEAIGGERARQRLRAVHRPVGPHRPRPVEGQHDRQHLQPQLPEAQRRQRRTRRRSSRRPTWSSPTRWRARSTSIRSPTRSPTDDGVAGEARPAGRRGRCRRRGFDPGESRLPRPARRTAGGVEVVVRPTRERLQLLEPFPAWDGKDYVELPVLMKAKGKCTTDHISAAGKWLKYRGHLENISGNLFLGVDQRLHRRDRRGQGPTRRRDHGRSPTSPSTTAEAGIRVVRGRRRELRRGLVARARRDGAALPQRPRRSSPAASPASTRRTSRSRACCR